MKIVFSHNSNLDQKENKVPERSFFSFLFLLSIVFLLCSCSSRDPFSEYASSTTWKGEGENGGTRDALEKIERYRTIRFLLVEKGEYKLAYRAVFAAAEQLGLDVRLTWTSPEHIPPLLRAGKADLAFSGNLTAPEELKRFHLEGYMLSVQGKEKRYDLFFVAQPGAQQLWQMLEKAVAASLMEERISFEDLAPEVEMAEKIPESSRKKDGEKKKDDRKEYGKNDTGKRVLKINVKKTEKKVKKRERIRRNVIRGLQKMKKEQRNIQNGKPD